MQEDAVRKDLQEEDDRFYNTMLQVSQHQKTGTLFVERLRPLKLCAALCMLIHR